MDKELVWCNTFVCVGYGGAFSVLAVELPSVEGTFDAVTDDTTADAQIGAQVRTVGVQNARLPVARTENHQILT